jgi:Ni,Fe-hydrogenase III small subunit/formate hydrogenlyase subunit 6/NADH:ubiquinone oxidoreductase subunit I
MPWIPRGLRNGIVTTRYPRAPDGYGPTFRGTIEVRADRAVQASDAVVAACPTGAITLEGGVTHLDHGKCVLCGRCVDLEPQTFRFSPNFETSALDRAALVVPDGDGSIADVGALRAQLSQRVKSLRRSIHVRHVDAGSDGSDEWEVAALTNPIYDVQRLGIYFTASPRHADVLLVTGAGTLGMSDALRHTYDAMPDPKVVVAAGVESISGGLVAGGYATRNGVSSDVLVDVYVPGSPATPFGLLCGILMAVDLLGRFEGRRATGGDLT